MAIQAAEKAVSIQPIVTGVMDMLQFNAEVKSVSIVNQIPEDFLPSWRTRTG